MSEETKVCSRCRLRLPSQSFSTRSNIENTLTSYCKECAKVYCRIHYQANKLEHNRRRYLNQLRYARENRARLREYLSAKRCVDCGEDDPLVLDCDHVRGSKEFNIANGISQYCWKRIELELAKCDVRCSNCHRRKTARERQWFKAGFGT